MHKNYSEAISKGEEKNRTEVDLCKLSNAVVAVGPKLKEAYPAYLRSCKERQDVIELTPSIFSEFSVIKQATFESEKFRVLIFGRGDQEDFSLKGYDIAAKAIVQLEDSSYRLIFVGAPDGKEEDVANKLLHCGISKDQLVVRKFVQSKERLKELFCEVDLAIMPSRTEGFGLTALEALSAGLPILVSGNSGFGDALRSLPLGKPFVVESAEPKEWAKAIAAVRLKDRAERLQEIQRLRTSYGDTFSWKEHCEDLVQKMRGLVHGKTFISRFFLALFSKGGLHLMKGVFQDECKNTKIFETLKTKFSRSQVKSIAFRTCRINSLHRRHFAVAKCRGFVEKIDTNLTSNGCFSYVGEILSWERYLCERCERLGFGSQCFGKFIREMKTSLM